MRILDCKNYVEKELKLVKKYIADEGIKPEIVIIYTIENKSMELYLRNKTKMLIEAGCVVECVNMVNESEESIIEEIKKYNNSVNGGIIIQLPLRDDLSADKLLSYINPTKDVDGLTAYNKLAVWNYNGTSIAPCTPLGIISFMQEEIGTFSFGGCKALVISRSDLVGKPMAGLLLSYDCTVTMAHSKTQFKKVDGMIDVSEYDIVVVGIGKAKELKLKTTNKNSMIFDVGINYKDGKLCGDIDIENSDIAGAITPVPNGVGKLTCLRLLINLLKCYKMNIK